MNWDLAHRSRGESESTPATVAAPDSWTATVALVFGLAGCAGQLDLANTFTDAAEDHGYICTDTVPNDDAVNEMVTCQSSTDGRVLLVTFDDDPALRASEGAFTAEDPEEQSSVVYGDHWLVVGSNDSNVTELAETLS